MNHISPVKTIKINNAEIARRRKALDAATANNRLEGIMPDPATDDIFEAAVNGHIEIADIIPALKARLGV